MSVFNSKLTFQIFSRGITDSAQASIQFDIEKDIAKSLIIGVGNEDNNGRGMFYIYFGRTIRELVLPTDLTAIEEEAFTNLSCEEVYIPEGCITIGERAFANCSNLQYVSIPATVTSYPANAFEGCNENLVIDWTGH